MNRLNHKDNHYQGRSSKKDTISDKRGDRFEKKQFWEKVKEIRFNHRDRNRDWETMGVEEKKLKQVPLNKQMGFKSRLKIGQSNPSKKIKETQKQRVEFDKHEDGTECIQKDQMAVKHLIDLSEVKCHGFEKIIHAKKGWTPQTTRFITIFCCPSTRSKIEKDLIRRFNDREDARKRGTREHLLWTEKQKQHWKDINDEWKHANLIPGNHIQEDTMEDCLKMIEEVQLKEHKFTQLILPPIVLNDKGMVQMEKSIASMTWKLENGSVLETTRTGRGNHFASMLPKLNQEVSKLDNFESDQEVTNDGDIGCKKASWQLSGSTVVSRSTEHPPQRSNGERIHNRQNIHEPGDQPSTRPRGLRTLEIPGQPVFQIFANDWINMQRYYLMFNLEIGYIKIEIGRSGKAVEKQEVERIAEKKNEALWQWVEQEADTEMINQTSHIDMWDDLVLKNGAQFKLEREKVINEGEFSEAGEQLRDVEWYLSNDRTRISQKTQDGNGEEKSKRGSQEIEEKTNRPQGQESIQTQQVETINQAKEKDPEDEDQNQGDKRDGEEEQQ
ncbi:hypothetical protein OXYTRIMIC_515 [Oxytricha trifallax]|uniref:Uncharacterized protein n=1 Tax=Oxytricha trifallax TaxID=1172189 RepID=A0A073HYS3_9SPIT|nr:hypothetical protein OXYTRIMIC_515 [Oxytricha trifallax]